MTAVITFIVLFITVITLQVIKDRKEYFKHNR